VLGDLESVKAAPDALLSTLPAAPYDLGGHVVAKLLTEMNPGAKFHDLAGVTFEVVGHKAGMTVIRDVASGEVWKTSTPLYGYPAKG
jgi:hypothetical protein